ncbi:MAG: D-alanyl-D-alanine carboxypeptidase family protein [Bacillota bacterium]
MRKMIGKKLIAVCLAVLLLAPAAAPAAAASPEISAASAILMDAQTGQVYYEKKSNARREPASLTKIMTSIIALEYGHPEEVVTVGKKAASICVGQELMIRKGDRMTLEDLIKAALIYSANDSTVAIAEHIAGSEENFVRLMNAKALAIGALDTHYGNTNGYHHPNHYTTAYDLALITRYALGNEQFARIVKTPRTTIHFEEGRAPREISNTNMLVRENAYEGILGVKTGSTIRAGRCLIAAAQRGDRTLIAVVLHCRDRYKDAVALLDYGFGHVSPAELCVKGESFGSIPVEGGVTETVTAVSERGITVDLADDDRKKVTKTVNTENTLQAPVKAGQKVGTAIYSLRNRELARVNLVAAEDVMKPGVIYRLRQLF